MKGGLAFLSVTKVYLALLRSNVVSFDVDLILAYQ